MYTDIQRREIFHFCFLERLLNISDPSLYVLKGGVNLRFFFDSPRYSEDMDLDVTAGSIGTLKKNGYKILEDAGFRRSLRTFGIDDIEINDPAKAKHTETTQRFRFRLITSSGIALPTKIEFSRRGNDIENPPMDLIQPELARQYHKLSYRCCHYPGEIAARQKILALAGRPATQARDVFDLYLLHRGGYATSHDVHAPVTKVIKEQALEATISLGFDDFQGQVLEFLDEQHRTEFDNNVAWEVLQESVLRLIDDA